jgi:hypothetical protein
MVFHASRWYYGQNKSETMELTQAFASVAQVLQEEKTRPTLLYHYVSDEWPPHRKWQQYFYEQKSWKPAMAAWDWLTEERKQRPRYVYEDPKLFSLKSTNFGKPGGNRGTDGTFPSKSRTEPLEVRISCMSGIPPNPFRRIRITWRVNTP